MTLKLFLFVLSAEVFACWAQVMFKKGSASIAAESVRGVKGYIRFIGDVLRIPQMWVGFSMIGATITLWLAALALGDLSLVMPLDSMQYILIMAASYLFLGERITFMRILGTLSIVAGIILVGIS